jgi:hypothetical protein
MREMYSRKSKKIQISAVWEKIVCLACIKEVHIYLLTHSWSWALLEEPQIRQLLKNFPAFYRTQRFITVFTRTLHSTGPYPEPDLSNPYVFWYSTRQITSRRIQYNKFITHSLVHLYNSQIHNYCHLQYHSYFCCSHFHPRDTTGDFNSLRRMLDCP